MLLTCPHCGNSADVPDSKAGQSIRCRVCQQLVTVPSGSDHFSMLDEPTGEPDLVDSPFGRQRRSAKADREPGDFGVGCLGVLLIVFGGIALAVFIAMDTTVFVGSAFAARVHNLGLMNDRLIGVIISGGAFALGVVCLLLRRR